MRARPALSGRPSKTDSPLLEIMKKIALALLLLFCFRAVFAVTPFIITDIRVEGLERLEAGTVFNYLPLKVGDELNDEEARLSIKELFSTGFFKDVVLEQDGTTLVVKVVERPSIAEITITGNKVLESEALQNGLEQVGLVQGRIFNSTSLARVEQEIKDTYFSLGRYSATIESTVEELDRNRVAITLKIDEGRVATIKKVNIIGAKEIPASKLIDEMSLRDKRGFRLFSKRNQYSKQKLEADIEAIRSYYLDRGYHDFQIVSSNVEISPNKQNIFISINIDEGARYVFGDTVFESPGDVGIAGLEQLITIERGEPFSRKVVNASRSAITEKYSDQGYAFAEVRSIYETDREAKVVKTIFVIEPKQRVYVRKIEVTGNLSTRDQVIRRELRQFEGASYSTSAVSRSKERLQRLGYFERVTIETPAVPGTTDQVDMQVVVKERNTGSISFSVGYSDVDGALYGLNYSQRNLLGTGRELDFIANVTDVSESGQIVYTNPYHTPDGISRGFSLTSRQVDTSEVNSANYLINTTAGRVNYKIPIAETNSLNLGVTLEEIEIESSTSGTPREFQEVIDDTFMTSQATGIELLIALGVSKDSRNDFFFPTQGSSRSASVELAFPGSEYEYYKLNLQNTHYVPLPRDFAAKTSIRFGFGDGFGDSDELPFFRRYFAGGSNSVRGYDSRALGPKSSGFVNCTAGALSSCSGDGISNKEPVGGDKRLLVNAELLFPPFGAEGVDKRFSLFLDGGMVYGPEYSFETIGNRVDRDRTDQALDLSRLRWSTGIQFNWFSPIGPISMFYSEALNNKDGDDTDAFQITVGTVFE